MTPRRALDLVEYRVESAWILSNETLADLLRHAVAHEVHDGLKAEWLFRWWLLREVAGSAAGRAARSFRESTSGDPERLQFFDDLLAAFHLDEARSQPALRLYEAGAEIAPPLMRRYFQWRAERCLDAHGFIPLIAGNHANSLPFRLEHSRTDRWRFADTDGREVASAWLPAASNLNSVAPDSPWQVHLHGFLPQGLELEGNSFCLPLALAAYFRNFGEFDPLSIVATGALENGCLTGVEGCELKREMAVRQSAKIFVCPEAGLARHPEIATLQIPCGTPWEAVRESIQTELMKMGLLRMDRKSAFEFISQLRNEGSSGHGNPQTAIPQMLSAIETLEQSLRDPEVKFPQRIRQHLQSARLNLASLHNHAGDPESARQILTQLHAGGSDREKCESAARLVVSLTDAGRFSEAWLVAEDALSVAEAISQDSDDGRLAKLEIFGAVGCDLLLQIALRKKLSLDAPEVRKSWELLERNLDLSEELLTADLRSLDSYENFAKSLTRTALWKALLEPECTEERIAQIRAHPEVRRGLGKSEPYLRRIRFLGEYRRRLFAGGAAQPHHWLQDLPAPMRGGGEWVLATTLKYRGALRSLEGNTRGAEADIAEALALLAGEQPPVFRLLRWSIAAEAFCSLQTVPKKIRDLLDCDRMVTVEHLHGDSSGKVLAKQIKACHFNEFAAPETRRILREFQHGFVY